MLIHLNLIQSICQERKIYLKPDEVNDVEILPEMLFSSKICVILYRSLQHATLLLHGKGSEVIFLFAPM